ncbi:hypothetical protein EUGRSUZ_E01375 [Eucalyptus grandis]|uniref:Uncharacterized protein n=2 Tax=Eucalyptus grandis TaxID=71139 RepID=A0A059C4V3_EUCGR|nr:hypothetical protein EUGRSUZ_E01375 [Eucalyptus grandis]
MALLGKEQHLLHTLLIVPLFHICFKKTFVFCWEHLYFRQYNLMCSILFCSISSERTVLYQKLVSMIFICVFLYSWDFFFFFCYSFFDHQHIIDQIELEENVMP